MNKTLLTATLSFISAATLWAADGFRIEADIPGLREGTEIELVSMDPGREGTLASGKSAEGGFVLTGDVSAPAYCQLRINALNEDKIGKELTLMVENGLTTIRAEHIDSVPPSFFVGMGGVRLGRKVKIDGGRAQAEYNEFNEAMYPYMLVQHQAHYDCYWAPGSSERTDDRKKHYEDLYHHSSDLTAEARDRFVREHPTYSISGLMMLVGLGRQFNYTEAELDEIEKSTTEMTDKARLAQITEALKTARLYPRDKSYTDITLCDTELKDHALSEYAGNGKYTLVDFWASWCMPCRMAIPEVRGVYEKFGDKVNVISVSIDQNEQAWRKALEEEKMPWTQLWTGNGHDEAATAAYKIKSIPLMVVISGDGKIVFAGNDPEAAGRLIEEAVR